MDRIAAELIQALPPRVFNPMSSDTYGGWAAEEAEAVSDDEE
jgi:hypothetical protein